MRYKMVVGYVVMLLWTMTSMSTFAVTTSFEEVVEKVSIALKEGNAKKMGTIFNNNVNLSLKGDEGAFTKFQAELLLKDFFRTNKVDELKEVRRGNNASTSFVVFSLKTSSKSYRVFLKLLQSNKDFKVAEIRIE